MDDAAHRLALVRNAHQHSDILGQILSELLCGVKRIHPYCVRANEVDDVFNLGHQFDSTPVTSAISTMTGAWPLTNPVRGGSTASSTASCCKRQGESDEKKEFSTDLIGPTSSDTTCSSGHVCWKPMTISLCDDESASVRGSSAPVRNQGEEVCT